MQVSFNWLKEYVDIDITVTELQELMTKAGVTIEHVEPTNKGAVSYTHLYQDEKERLEFAAILESFVQMQEPVVAQADVLWQAGGFEVRDEKGCDLKKIYETSLLLEHMEDPEDISGEDLLLSILITVVPAKLVIHGDGTKEALGMVALVFEDRLHWCSGCELCRKKNFERL